MNSNRIPRVVLITAAALAVGAALTWLGRHEQALRSYAAETEARFVALHRQQVALKARPAPTEATARSGAAEASARRATRQRSQAAAMDSWIIDAMQKLPEYAPFNRMQNQRFAVREYGDWFRQLSVAPERLAVIKQAVADAIEKRSRDYDALIGTGVEASSAEYRNGAKRIDADMDAELGQVLTSDEYRSLSQFKRAQTWNSRLPEIDAFFDDRAVPALTPEQRRVFLAATIDAGGYQPEGPAPAPAALFRLRTERIGALAAPALPPAQRDALLAYLAFYNQRTKLMAQILNPSDPDAMDYTGTKAF